MTPDEITDALDRLAKELVREGWTVVPIYKGQRPVLHVYDRDVPHLGEGIMLVPGTEAGTWWYRSSMGENLAPHTKPFQAAERIARIHTPYVAAIQAARSRHRQIAQAPKTSFHPPIRPEHATIITDLQRRFPDVVCWWGAYTGEWWALIPGGTRWRLANASDPGDLVQIIATAS
ncbi:hypothetical protein F8568_027635 [Actinomadura sp. LD22]|uniref:Uncharacterized protein n=1 Tax=Actinomadura physcomitrii TaxID=2650748 RepID=A0A6I4MJC8_9ACTN|nr:hypothetical protein [Actinomadura physcomitrii]MWA04087.1 hypothetical protein [Actinomadura physcomitrii]